VHLGAGGSSAIRTLLLKTAFGEYNIAKALTVADCSSNVGIAHGIRRLALGHWSQSQWAFADTNPAQTRHLFWRERWRSSTLVDFDPGLPTCVLMSNFRIGDQPGTIRDHAKIHVTVKRKMPTQ
jgi:hypothetical protein